MNPEERLRADLDSLQARLLRLRLSDAELSKALSHLADRLNDLPAATLKPTAVPETKPSEVGAA